MRKTNKELAMKLYEYNRSIKLGIKDTAVLWATIFSKDELVELWNDCRPQNPDELYKLDIPYDDELYNALNIIHNYFD